MDETCNSIECVAVSTKMKDLTFLPMLYILTNASIDLLSYVKMLSYPKK